MAKQAFRRKKGILVLRDYDENKEIEFELGFLRSLSLNQRILMMEAKSREMKSLLTKNGHREIIQIIKRK